MGEQEDDRADTPADPPADTPADTPADPAAAGPAAATPESGKAASTAAPPGRHAVRLGHGVRAVLDLLAAAVRVVAFVCAAVLVVRILLAFVTVNPHNVIVQWIIGGADAVVLAFRDLFLPADPRIGLVVNYGLAAVFWLAAGLVVAGVLNGVGRRVAGRG